MAPSIPQTNVSPVTPIPSLKFQDTAFMSSELTAPQMSPLSDAGDDKAMFQNNADIDCWFTIPDPPMQDDPTKTTCDVMPTTDVHMSDKYVRMPTSMDIDMDLDSTSRAQVLSSCVPRPVYQADNIGMPVELVSPAPSHMASLMTESHEVLSSLSFLNDPAVPVQSVVPSVELFGSVGEILDVNNQSMAFQDEECYMPLECTPEVSLPIASEETLISGAQQPGKTHVPDHEAIANAVEGTQEQGCQDLPVAKSHQIMTPSQICHNILQNNILTSTSARAVSDPRHPPVNSDLRPSQLSSSKVGLVGRHLKPQQADIHPRPSVSLVLPLSQQSSFARRIATAKARGDMDMLTWLQAKENQLRNKNPEVDAPEQHPVPEVSPASSHDNGKRRRRRPKEFKFEMSAASSGVAKSSRSKGSSSKKRSRTKAITDVPDGNAPADGETTDPNLPDRERCARCNLSSKNTPMMRKGPDGARSLCNACGLKWKRHGIY